MAVETRNGGIMGHRILDGSSTRRAACGRLARKCRHAWQGSEKGPREGNLARTSPRRRHGARADGKRPVIDHVVTVRAGDETVGAARVVQYRPEIARITMLRVSPEWWHTSVLKRLIRDVQDLCRSRGVQMVEIAAGAAPAWMLRRLRRQ